MNNQASRTEKVTSENHRNEMNGQEGTVVVNTRCDARKATFIQLYITRLQTISHAAFPDIIFYCTSL